MNRYCVSWMSNTGKCLSNRHGKAAAATLFRQLSGHVDNISVVDANGNDVTLDIKNWSTITTINQEMDILKHIIPVGHETNSRSVIDIINYMKEYVKGYNEGLPTFGCEECQGEPCYPGSEHICEEDAYNIGLTDSSKAPWNAKPKDDDTEIDLYDLISRMNNELYWRTPKEIWKEIDDKF